MMKVEEYREQAAECRRLAKLSASQPHLIDEFMKMAEVWESLAQQREQEEKKKAQITARLADADQTQRKDRGKHHE